MRVCEEGGCDDVRVCEEGRGCDDVRMCEEGGINGDYYCTFCPMQASSSPSTASRVEMVPFCSWL